MKLKLNGDDVKPLNETQIEAVSRFEGQYPLEDSAWVDETIHGHIVTMSIREDRCIPHQAGQPMRLTHVLWQFQIPWYSP